MPGPTSIQGTLIIKHALAVRPVNSRVPCYFEYKNFQGIAKRESKRGRERERERRAGEREPDEEGARKCGFEILQGLPRQPSKRVTELSICMSERCRFADLPPAMRINIQSAHDRLRFASRRPPPSPQPSPSPPILASLARSPPSFLVVVLPSAFVFNSLYAVVFTLSRGDSFKSLGLYGNHD